MRNRAKCKLCSTIIESLHRYDYVSCKCNEISISGGVDKLECAAKDFSNFIRIDEDGKEVPVKVVEKPNEEKELPVENDKPIELTREQKVDLVDAMIKYYDDLPAHAMMSSPSQYDLKAAFLMMKQLI